MGVVTALGFACMTSGASAAPAIVDEIPVDPDNLLYAIEPDGTSVWQTSWGSSTINELSPETGKVVKSFEHGYLNNWTPRGLAYFSGRVYVADPFSPMRLVSWDAESADTTDPGRVTSDDQMNNRLGTNQGILRTSTEGGALALGQSNKVATFNPADLDSTPYYPHSIFGAGISDPNGQNTAFQACAYSGGGVIIGNSDPDCGFYLGHPGGAPGQFGYAIDSAFGDGGMYVLELNDNEVSFVSLNGDGCPCAGFDFPLPSGPSGGANFPLSIRRVPATGNLLISSSGNRRIDEVTTTGARVRSFGFGVRTGGSQFESCAAQCLPGLPTSTEPRSNFTRLDIVNGLLYAATPNDDSIQVISLAEGETVDLSARPRRVDRGDDTTLTATISSCPPRDKVLFQRKAGTGWDDLGNSVRVDGACKASKQARIARRSIFRAIWVDRNGATVATSPRVTVELR
jgi:hypothetical protein